MDMQTPRDSEFPSDLSPLAWVEEELRRSLESVHKALRRQLRDADNRVSSFGGDGPSAPLQAAAVQLHQVAGVLSLVGLPAGTVLLRAAERAVAALAQHPTSVDPQVVETIERADFALMSFISRLLAGNTGSPLALFPAYRELQKLNDAERVHPADLWGMDWRWRELPADASAAAQPAASVRAPFEQALLKQMREPGSAHAQALSDLCAGLAAGFDGQPHSRTLWQLAAAVFEAEVQNLLKPDAYLKRNGSRLLSQIRKAGEGDAGLGPAGERLAQDLLFFCGQTGPVDAGAAPRLAAARTSYDIAGESPVDYENSSLGRIDPNWVAQAKRRVVAAKDSWSSAAEGDMHRVAGLDEQFAGLSESLARLFPNGEVLGTTLQRAVVATLRSGRPPQPALAMEVATSILYVEAALEDAAFDQPEQAERVRQLSSRVDAVAHGQEPEPLEAWMEDLYRRVSDRQTLGSVVHELRASLSEIEKQADAYFRDPSQRELLIPVPNQLQTMRGVLSVLGMGQAAAACVRMRDEVDELANTEVDPTLPGPRNLFDRLANNLGALGFLIDMLSVQPALAKRMFRFDEAEGRLEPIMGRRPEAETGAAPLAVAPQSAAAMPAFDAALPVLDFGSDAAPPAAAPVAPAAPAVVTFTPPSARPPADPEMLEIFLEEAGEVLETARGAVAALREDAGNHEQLTTLRRAFHTLKGSSRMVGLDAFGEAGWACEQLLNARLADSTPKADAPLLSFSNDALDYFGAWRARIEEHHDDGDFTPAPVRASADALRLHGELQPIAAAPAAAAAPAEPEPPPHAALAEVPVLESALEPALEQTVEPAIEVPEIIEAPEAVEVPFTEELAAAPAGVEAHELTEADFELDELRALHAQTEPMPFPATEQVPLAAAAVPAPAVELPSFDLKLDLGDEPQGTAALMEPLESAEPAIPDLATLLEAATEHAELGPIEGLQIVTVQPEVLEGLHEPTLIEPRAPAPDEIERTLIEPRVPQLHLVASEPPAAAEPEPATEAQAEDEDVKVIGPLRIGIALFNIFLNEADELSRRLGTELAEWSVELGVPVPPEAEAHAHKLAGNAATVGFEDLSALARALEHALGRAAHAGRYAPDAALLFMHASDEIRRLLHQFAAGFLNGFDPALRNALEAYEPEIVEPTSVSGELDDAPLESAVPSADADEPEPGLPDHIEPELFGFFEEEAVDLLEQLHAALREWADQPQGRASEACMRVLHTFKGGARLAGAMRLGEAAHELESAVEHVVRGGAASGAQILQLQDRADRLDAGYHELCERLHAPVAPPAAAPAPAPAPAAPEPVAALPVVEPVAEPPAEPIAVPGAEIQAQAPAEPDAPVVVEPVAEMPTAAPRAPAEPTRAIDWASFIESPDAAESQDSAVAGAQALLRVRVSLLERMAAQAGEVSVRRSRIESELAQMKSALLDLDDNLDRLRSHLRELEVQAEAQMGRQQAMAEQSGRDFDPLEFDRYTRFQELTRQLAESVGDVATVQRGLQRSVQSGEDELAAQSRLTRELQDDLLRTRMVEFESVGERMHRVVRQAARDAGKLARLEIVGGQTELDRSVLERMAGSFEHLLRNSVSHGLETAEARQAAGKDPTGTLRVELQQQGNEILLDFTDDGAGLNIARIRERGLQQGLIQPDENPSDEALMQLIFAPGFSTASQITALSGRGVGMDVVRAEVSTLGGTIETSSTPGQGARFQLRLPLTTALTQIVLLRVGEQVVAVPAGLMDSVQRLPGAAVDAAYAAGQIELGGNVQPFFWLGGLLGQEGRGHGVGKTQAVALVRGAHRRLALHVDEVVGNQEVVVKNLGPQLHRVPGLAGISLLASGDIALIYNPMALADWYGVAAQQRLRADAAPVQPVVDVPVVEAPLVFVVDDSLTVRRATQRLLEREGFRVLLAKDGLDAMEKLAADELPMVVLSDIEMPRMDGFDLVRNMRDDVRLKDLPVIMITSRIAQKHREYAATLGVDHYLGKPYDEDQLLDLVRRYTRAHIAAG
ncbi:MAG: Hpt domain-containing protein [Paucibacter sp.]|nr:Hpt domain-containing protein [Roseateles sp.]